MAGWLVKIWLPQKPEKLRDSYKLNCFTKKINQNRHFDTMAQMTPTELQNSSAGCFPVFKIYIRR